MCPGDVCRGGQSGPGSAGVLPGLRQHLAQVIRGHGATIEVTLVTISAYVKAAGGGRYWGIHGVILHRAQGALSRPVGRGQDVSDSADDEITT